MPPHMTTVVVGGWKTPRLFLGGGTTVIATALKPLNRLLSPRHSKKQWPVAVARTVTAKRVTLSLMSF